MRILILHNKYRQAGGEDIVFQAECKLLKGKGHEVKTLVFTNDGTIAPLKLIHNKDSVKQFRQVAEIFQPDILHVHNLFLKASPAILQEANQLNIPVVMTLHNYRLMCANALLLRNEEICEKCVSQKIPISGVMHGCYRNSRLASIGMVATTNWHRLKGTWKNDVQRYIALTSFGKNKVLSSTLGLVPNQIVIKPNFIEDPSLGSLKRENRLLFVGRLSEEKGIHTLLEAHRSNEFELEIIGDGPLKGLVEKASKGSKSLIYKGKCDRTYLLNRMQSVKAVIVPSIWYEPFGMTIIEAFACGTPVIASKIGSIPDIVSDTVNGWLFEADDSKSLLSKIFTIPEGEAWQRISKSARRTYLKKYTPEVNYSMLMNIYQEVIQENK